MKAIADPTRPGVLVEFVGLPGSGKSTIVRALGPLLSEAGYECLDSPVFARVERGGLTGHTGRILRAMADGFRGMAYTLRSRRLCTRLIPEIFQGHVLSTYWRMMRIWAALTRIDANDRRSGRRRVVLLDQGLLQCLPYVYPEGISLKAQQELTILGVESVRSVLPDLVVAVSVDEATAAMRMRGRPFQRTSYDLASARLEEELTPHRWYTEVSLPEALKELAVPYLRLDGHGDPGSNAQVVMEKISGDMEKREG